MSDYTQLKQAVLNRYFARMNDRQRQAVFHTEGPLLLLAGAGSGKTTVLIHRIANLVRFGRASATADEPDALSEEERALLTACAAGEQPIDSRVADVIAVDPCPAWRILAITFTNKAAGELKDRLAAMLGDKGAQVMAGTFHSFCARILRQEGECLGFSSHFTIYDTDDSKRLMKDCLKSLNLDDKAFPPKMVLGEISRAKDQLWSPEDYAAQPHVRGDFRLKRVADVYTLYQKRLHEADAMDFDDLLSQTVFLFERFPEVLERWQRRFCYIMVDEYQDTNHAQYRLVSLLAAHHRNLCVVGDDDQSIYKFRGADIENILNFEEEFSGCTVIRLEQNYRSTGTVLDAANAVIAQNKMRKGKTLWTQNPRGESITEAVLDNADEEARYIADLVVNGVARDHRRYGDFAVLCRMRAQFNTLEQALVKSGVPYRVIGGHRFYESQEIRDIIAYMRLIVNPQDAVSLKRAIQQPKRGIGDATVQRASDMADQMGVSLYEVMADADRYPDLSRAAKKLAEFIGMIEDLRRMLDAGGMPLHEWYDRLLEKTGYLAMWQAAGEAEAERVENLLELKSGIQTYEENNAEGGVTLTEYLEEISLMTDVDNYDAGADAAVLMTMHAAKGLEFPVVVLPGFEDGVFPGNQVLFNPADMEEERRLCYVAITRAKEKLYCCRAVSRMMFGTTNRNRPSQFLGDIPHSLLDRDDRSHGYAASWSSRSRDDDFEPIRWNDDDQTPAYEHSPRSGFASGGSSAGRRAGASAFSGGQSSFRKPAATAPSTPRPVWAVGDRVSHATFGNGIIRAAAPMGNDLLLTIDFDKAGTKKLMANYARLTRQ